MTVYFKPSGYSNPSIYFWGAANGATTSWPGESMTSIGAGWYSYTFTGGGCSNIIFSNNGASQTADLNRCADGWYNGSWHNTNPDGARFGSTEQAIEEPLQVLTVRNYPNPFTNHTTISFSLPKTGDVHLKVYNLMGKEVATLANGRLEEGTHQLVFNGEKLSTGIYIFRLNYANQSITGKMIMKK